ncbi:MAG: hypothetical protein PUB25_01255 [Lachnospiraceae bacterium]|nr:hypothetical protein [Lachnospiraceae bacterium]
MEKGKQERVRKIKKTGALAAGIAVSAVIVIQILVYTLGFLQDMPPVGIVVLFLVIPVAVLAAVIYVTDERIREIEGGEEDEASKY